MTKACDRKNNNYFKVISFVVNIFTNFLNKLLKVTLWQLLWALLIIFFIVIWTWNDSKDINNIVKNTSSNPVILWWTGGFPESSETRYCPNNIQCYVSSNKSVKYDVEAYLMYGSNINFSDLPLPRTDVIWGLYHEESPRNVEEFMHEPALNIFNFSSTYSRHSDVPFPLQYLDSLEDITSKEYYLETAVKNSYLDVIAPIMYLQSDCETSTERDAYVQELMKIARIDSYGTCLNNKVLPLKFTQDYLNNLNEGEFLRFVARYKFVIAMENGVCEDYITEKLWRNIKVGTVPIYFGSPSIRDWLPNKNSAILLIDYPTPKILNEHITKLLDDDRLYEEYLEHKTKQVITNKRLIQEIKERPYQLDPLETIHKFECLICEKIHEKHKAKSDVHVVNKSHYNCPKPISALTLKVNPTNNWVYTWETEKRKVEEIYKTVMTQI